MALMKCPECNNNVSSKASACPSCGFDVKNRHWFSKKWGKYIIGFIVIIVLFISFKSYRGTKSIIKKIDDLMQYEILPASKTEKVLNMYENLSMFEKPFVYNYRKIKNKKIELSNNLLKKFLDINITYSNYEYNENINILGFKTYKETSYIFIDINKKKKCSFSDVEFEINLGNSYKFVETQIFTLTEFGKLSYNGEIINNGILNNNIISSPKEPIYEPEKLNFKNINGYIYIK